MIGKTYKLVHALDGMEAIQLYEKYSPNLILMDIKMPNLDGLDATSSEKYPPRYLLLLLAPTLTKKIKQPQ